VYKLSIPFSSCIFYPEYPENPKNLGENIRKARIDRGLMIRELGELAGANETTVINCELKGRRAEEWSHWSL